MGNFLGFDRFRSSRLATRVIRYPRISRILFLSLAVLSLTSIVLLVERRVSNMIVSACRCQDYELIMVLIGELCCCGLERGVLV